MEYILVIFDGLGDRPIPEFNNLTPLEAANTPTLDQLAKEGICGLMHSLGRGIRPGSDTSHLAILGYDPKKYYNGRGPIEVAGIGISLKEGDVALRANLGTVDEDMIIKDRRAGRIEDVTPFVKELTGITIDGIEFIIEPGTGHRAGLVMRGKGLSSKISDADPHKPGVKVEKVRPLDNSIEAKFTAEVLNKFLEKAHDILKAHPLNIERAREKKPSANYLLVRGAGTYRPLPPFIERFGLKGCCIAGGGLYKGVARYLGFEVLEVEGATAKPNSNIKGKIEKALSVKDEFDMAFIHIKATDSLGEDGNYEGKKEFIEKADKALKPLLYESDILITITGDHSTPCALEQHSGDPVPILMRGPGIRVDDVTSFGERACSKGGLGHINGLSLMKEVLNILGRASLVGA